MIDTKYGGGGNSTWWYFDWMPTARHASLLFISGSLPAVYTGGSDQGGNFTLTRYRFR
ncbi:hypothetical protein [Amycolatopsis nigrescens]|uniref:hypothetical protein n=1 Tax=Amycolatopsis nigrescens TaxID=381445 RepID=UPI00037C0A15|nr:hypothetical protein [Amycolatopsis nigrescens]